ncbi:MAG: protease inhibitor I42 family protein [Planctomycetes bacterium]|nr:protease inhibitor I42 family protein [Planctomycetota bacterium]
MKRLIAIAVCLFCLGLSTVRSGEEKATTITNVDDKGKEKSDGGTMKLAKGAILNVKLQGNPTTGFSWGIDKNDKDVLAPKGKYSYEPTKKGLPGGGGTFSFQFKAEKAGTSELELGYKRPFEKDKAPAKMFKVKVEVE